MKPHSHYWSPKIDLVPDGHNSTEIVITRSVVVGKIAFYAPAGEKCFIAPSVHNGSLVLTASDLEAILKEIRK